MKTLSGQKKRIIDHMNKYGFVTRLIAFTQLGIFELSSRIVGLERLGYVFAKESRQGTNRFSEKFHYTIYRLKYSPAE